MSAQPVISIIGGTLWGNRGAQSMLETTIGVLRESFPDACFNIFSYYPKKDRALVSGARVTVLSATPLSLITRHLVGALAGALLKAAGLKVPRRGFFRIAAALSESDALLDIGGITFSDGREKFLLFNILCIWPAMLLGVPVVKMAQALGPFRGALNRRCARVFLPRCRRIFARGDQTAKYLSDVGLAGARYEASADIAFLYQPDHSLTRENENLVDALAGWMRQQKERGKKVIVLSPSTLVENQSRRKGMDYAENFFAAMRALGGAGYAFVFMPNATRAGSDKAHNNDLLTIMNWKNRAESGALPAEILAAANWVDFDINAAGIRRIIAGGDLLVTSRYHAMISGLCLAVPTLVLGWGHKYRETMREFNLETYSLDFGESADELAGLIRSALGQTAKIRDKIAAQQERVASLAKKQFTFLEELFR